MTAQRVHIGVELTLRTPRHLRELLFRHTGARRFAYNWCKARAKAAKSKRRTVGRSEQRIRATLRRRFARQRNLRNYHLHQVTRSWVTQASVIGLEDLNVAGMLKNRGLARSIAQQAWGELRRQLTYTSGWTGTKLVLIDRFFPSTQRCSTCGQSKAPLLCLNDAMAATGVAQRWTATSMPPSISRHMHRCITTLLPR